MALFSSNKRVVFQPTAYGSSRRRRGVPRWLMLILTGVVLGAGGVLFLQKSYGPKRLTVEQSEQLHHDLNSANIDKQRLQSELAQHTQDLAEAKATIETQASQLRQAQEQVAKQQQDIQLLASDIPPDPRGTSPGIRAAEFRNDAGQLDYRVLVMQDNADSPIFDGKMTLVVEGTYPNGRSNTVSLPPVEFNVGRYNYVQGSLPLPDGLKARLVTIRVTEGDSARLSAMRIIRAR